jgi:hypothetical protein
MPSRSVPGPTEMLSTTAAGAGSCTKSVEPGVMDAIAATAASSAPIFSNALSDALPCSSCHPPAVQRRKWVGGTSLGSRSQRTRRVMASVLSRRATAVMAAPLMPARGIQTRNGRGAGAAQPHTSSRAPGFIDCGRGWPAGKRASHSPRPRRVVTRRWTVVWCGSPESRSSLPASRPFTQPPETTTVPSARTFSMATTARSARRSGRMPRNGLSLASVVPASTGS